MPPATPGRYQSRLFNFFHQQSRRWGQQFERTIRHVQVAANWSLEALLTSVYLLIRQATESAGKQLHTNEQQPRFQLQENQTEIVETVSVDTPIQRVLEAAVTLQIPEAGDQGSTGTNNSHYLWIPHFPLFPTVSSPLTPSLSDSLTPSSPPIVRGIASDLGNRNLVLVTIENEILDILTPQQQEILQNRILDEVATYWHSCELTQSEDQTKVLSEIDRLLNKLTGSKKSIPALPQATGTEFKNQYKKLPNLSQKLPLLDTAIAQIESRAVVTISRTSGQLLQAVQNQLNIFIYGKEQQLTTEQRSLDGNWEHQASKIQALIWGAINYFFGERNTNKLEQKTPTNSIDALSIGFKNQPKTVNLPQRPSSSVLPESPDLPSENIEDPWLTMDDLFGDLQEVTEVVNEQQLLVTSSESPKSALPASPSESPKSALPASPSVKIRRQINFKSFSVLSQAKELIQNSKYSLRSSYENKIWKFSSSSDSPISQFESDSNLIKDNKGEILYQQQKTTQVEAKPDWIETQAQTIGYAKHPLEQVLEWLDRIMLWLEEIFVKIGVFLRKVLRIK
ncbi:hypothetical protein [Brasilonema bromeliae]|uniref:Uncharacterized protein n=2 Tax=Bromeliae group (in: Brasilonema) TaxID=3398495 RepID=A0ABX1P9U2_9CYAN|nr:hypothetical protein [Brasilonema bromeliae]NMG21209.1 hypothetical protein [Brasilonema bromeliae SPC951]